MSAWCRRVTHTLLPRDMEFVCQYAWVVCWDERGVWGFFLRIASNQNYKFTSRRFLWHSGSPERSRGTLRRGWNRTKKKTITQRTPRSNRLGKKKHFFACVCLSRSTPDLKRGGGESLMFKHFSDHNPDHKETTKHVKATHTCQKVYVYVYMYVYVHVHVYVCMYV